MSPGRPHPYGGSGATDRGFVLLGLDRLHVHTDLEEGELWVHASQMASPADGEISVDLTVMNGDSKVLAEACGVRGRRLQPAEPAQPGPERTHRHGDCPDPAAGMLPCAGAPRPARTATAPVATGCSWEPAPRWPPRCASTALQRLHRPLRYGPEPVPPGAPGEFRADLTAPDRPGRVLREASKETPLTQILHFGALGGPPGPTPRPAKSNGSPPTCAPDCCPWPALWTSRTDHRPEPMILTRGAQAVLDGDRVPAPGRPASGPSPKLCAWRCPGAPP